jgi:magnesium chelatase family protein
MRDVSVFVAAMNTRPCTYYSDSQKPCTCATAMVTKYQKRIPGPLLDRIDIYIELPCLDYEKLSSNRVGEEIQSAHLAEVLQCRPKIIIG